MNQWSLSGYRASVAMGLWFSLYSVAFFRSLIPAEIWGPYGVFASPCADTVTVYVMELMRQRSGHRISREAFLVFASLHPRATPRFLPPPLPLFHIPPSGYSLGLCLPHNSSLASETLVLSLNLDLLSKDLLAAWT